MHEFLLYMAPMEGITTPAFRKQCVECGADATFTEMARISGLARNNKSTVQKIEMPQNIPTYIQLSGPKENELNKFLSTFTPQPGFLGFNLNLGCPSPAVIREGAGCALIKRAAKVQQLVACIKAHGYNASVKLRLGRNQYEKEKKIYLKLIREVDADFFIVHARHGKEREEDPADTSVYPECVATGKIIIANGDIQTKKQIEELNAMGVRGAMIGRAAVNNPKIFSLLR
ncbi:MAG: tRNA-dihydrouridine synthase family protein [Candidatus Woesearchaeota archaeon]|nr:MAG: tRNA-dihydrouridine synthase family protein [Candidatus Woesearchaeota archaeon]